MNKVYREKTEWLPAVDSAFVSKEFYGIASEIAIMIDKLNELGVGAERLHRITDDAGDVKIEIDEAMAKLGLALAVTVNYASEYGKEASSDTEIEKRI